MIYSRLVNHVHQNSNTVSMKFKQNYEVLLSCKDLNERTRRYVLGKLFRILLL